MERDEFWIAGEPATFATRGELPWREALARSVPHPSKRLVRGMELDFVLPSLGANNHPLDVDNLCEPVFSVVINKIGWCGGRRPNMLWWHAKKVTGQPSGLRLSMHSDSAPTVRTENGYLRLDAIYTGPLPRKATDVEVPRWLTGLGPFESVQSDERFTVHFRFGGLRVNIGDVATGKVKSLLDSIYPVLGGRAGNPQDWRVDCLQVEKAFKALPEGHVQVMVWRT